MMLFISKVRKYFWLFIPSILLVFAFQNCGQQEGLMVLEKIQSSESLDFSSESNKVSGSNFTRSMSDVIAQRVSLLFPSADVTKITNPSNSLGQSLGAANFVTEYLLTTPTSPNAQASFKKYVISDLCKDATTMSNVFATNNILMENEVLPSAPEELFAFSAARNVWLIPYTLKSDEVTILVNLAKQIKADGGTADEMKKAICIATLTAPQFWIGNKSKFEVIKRIALELGQRAPKFSEFNEFNKGTLTVSQYVRNIQQEAGYLKSVKSWHRRWLTPKSVKDDMGPLRGIKFWWGWGGPTLMGGQQFIPQDSSGTLDPKIPIIRQVIQNSIELSDTSNCSAFPQEFDPTTQRIQWEQKVAGQWYIIGGWKFVNGAWVKFDGNLPIANTSTVTKVDDIIRAPATVNKTTFNYASGKLAGLGTFGPGDRRVRRFTKPDDIGPSETSINEQNGYSKVKLWWSGETVYVCNTLERFIRTCAYRPKVNKISMNGSSKWNAASGTLVMGMGGNEFIGVDTVAHPEIINDMFCSIDSSKLPIGSAIRKPNSLSFDVDAINMAYSKNPPYNEVIVNGEMTFATDNVLAFPTNATTKYTAVANELAAVRSISEDMTNEPLNLIESIVKENLDYRNILTANWTVTRGPLELYYQIQGHYLASYPLGFKSIPTDSQYMNLKKIYPMSFQRLPRSMFVNSFGGETSAANGSAFKGDNPGSASYPIDDINANALAPRPVSGLLTQTAYLGSAGPKIRSISAKIFKTFTCGDVSSYAPNQAAQDLQVQYIPIGEKSGAEHVDRKGTCFICHINMDPLASALSKGFLMKKNPFTGAPINSGSEWLYGFGELAPYETMDILDGFKYGVRGNVDMPSEGALFGQKVSGVREVGQVLANSNQFQKCAVQQAFTSVFGRSPSTTSDLELVDSITRKWSQSGFNYNKMIELLVSSSLYQVRD